MIEAAASTFVSNEAESPATHAEASVEPKPWIQGRAQTPTLDGLATEMKHKIAGYLPRPQDVASLSATSTGMHHALFQQRQEALAAGQQRNALVHQFRTAPIASLADHYMGIDALHPSYQPGATGVLGQRLLTAINQGAGQPCNPQAVADMHAAQDLAGCVPYPPLQQKIRPFAPTSLSELHKNFQF